MLQLRPDARPGITRVESAHPRPGDAADRQRSDHAEDLSPDLGRATDARQAIDRVIACDRRREGESGGDDRSKRGRADDREEELACYRARAPFPLWAQRGAFT